MKKKAKLSVAEIAKKHGVTINPELNKYQGVVLFPEKLKRANAILAQLTEADKILLGMIEPQNVTQSANELADATIYQADLAHIQLAETAVC